jgi:hypothetical protein
MIREIIFRGLPKDPSCFGVEFVYGSLRQEQKDLPDTHLIYTIEGDIVPIIPESQGQFIGNSDKEGNRLFEDDYCEIEAFWQEGNSFDGNDEDNHVTDFGVIKYTPSGGFYLKVEKRFNEISGIFEIAPDYKPIVFSRIKRLGNIHENPLLSTIWKL